MFSPSLDPARSLAALFENATYERSKESHRRFAGVCAVKLSAIRRMMCTTMVTASSRSWYRQLPRWLWIPVALLLLLIVLNVVISRRIPAVTLAPVTRGQAIAAVYAPGTVLSGTQTVIAATAASRIIVLSIQRGSNVAPGQVVAQLDSTQARLQLAQAQRQLETARAQLAQTSEPGDPYAVAQARAQLAQAQADYGRALDAVNAANAGLRGARAQVDQASAAVRTAQARVATAQRNVQIQQAQQRTAQEQINVAQAQVAHAQAELADAQDNLARQQSLYSQGAVPARNVVTARTAVSTAQANIAQAQASVQAAQRQADQGQASIAAAQSQVTEAYSVVDQNRAALIQAEDAVGTAQAQVAQARAAADSARQAITATQAHLAQTQRGQLPSAVRVAEAQVQTAQAAVAQAQDALSKYTIRSLVSGIVSDVPVHVGDFIPLGGAIANVVGQSQMYIQADVDEADIGPVRIGQDAYFTSDTLPDRTFQGVVTQVGASANTATNTYPVEIRGIRNPNGLRVNLSVDVNIVTSQNQQALLAPASAVVIDPQPHVWLVSASHLQYQSVTIGARDTAGGRIEIRSGLSEGDRVVSNPQPTFTNGQRARVIAQAR